MSHPPHAQHRASTGDCNLAHRGCDFTFRTCRASLASVALPIPGASLSRSAVSIGAPEFLGAPEGSPLCTTRVVLARSRVSTWVHGCSFWRPSSRSSCSTSAARRRDRSSAGPVDRSCRPRSPSRRRASTDPGTTCSTRPGVRPERTTCGSRPRTTPITSPRWSPGRMRASSATASSTTSAKTSSPRTTSRSGDGRGDSSSTTTWDCATRLPPRTHPSRSTRAIHSSRTPTRPDRSPSTGHPPRPARASRRHANR